MIAVHPPPSWHPDPSGRHEQRYWDGFTWTAHVADGATRGIDPLVRPAPVTPQVGEPLGPGTASLRAMADLKAATVAQVPATPAPTVRGRRRSLVYDLTAGIAMVMAVVLGGYVLWSSWLRSDAVGRTDPSGAVRWSPAADPPPSGVAYRIALPPSWVDATIPDVPGTTIEGAFQVIDDAPVVAFVSGVPAGAAPSADRDQVVAALDAAIATVPTPDGTPPQVTAVDVTTRGNRTIGVATADAVIGNETLRAVQHLVVTPHGAVLLLLYGEAASVDRHRDEARAVAESVTVRAPVTP